MVTLSEKKIKEMLDQAIKIGIERKDYAMVQQALDKGGDPRQVLFHSIWASDEKFFEMAIGANAVLDRAIGDGSESPSYLAYAINSRNWEFAGKLLDAGADPFYSTTSQTPLETVLNMLAGYKNSTQPPFGLSDLATRLLDAVPGKSTEAKIDKPRSVPAPAAETEVHVPHDPRKQLRL